MLTAVITSIKSLLVRAQDIRCKRKVRAMHLCETLSLGDRRFLLLVKVEGQKFLVGAAGNSISLLAQLPSRRDSEVRSQTVGEDALFDSKEYKV